jgi:Flp pilus assembly protein CpaB
MTIAFGGLRVALSTQHSVLGTKLMIQNKKLVQLVISAVLALAFVNFYLKGKEQALESAYGMVEVVAAARDIPPHTQLTAAYLTTKKVPLKFVEPGAFRVKIPGQGLDRIIGKVTAAAVSANAQITSVNLNDPSANTTGVAPLLPPGKRGYLLRLGNLDVAELILPGNYIDIMATFTIRQKDNSTTRATYTILQNILVIGVGRELRKPEQDVSSKKEGTESLVLTLALEPDEAERMALAQAESQGEISVVVRAHGDNKVTAVPGVTPAHLLDGAPVPAPRTPPK